MSDSNTGGRRRVTEEVPSTDLSLFNSGGVMYILKNLMSKFLLAGSYRGFITLNFAEMFCFSIQRWSNCSKKYINFMFYSLVL